MGNKARLRTLHLADGKTKEAGQLWPSYKDSNFTEHNHTPVADVRAVIEAIQAGREIDKVLVKKDIQSELSKELFACLKNTLIPVQRVPVERINRITRKNHQGVVAFISSVTYQKTENLVPFLFEEGKTPLFVMLDGITDVRNFGAIARTCECAGADAIIIPSKNSVSVNADAMKTSAGALHTLPVCREQSLTKYHQVSERLRIQVL